MKRVLEPIFIRAKRDWVKSDSIPDAHIDERLAYWQRADEQNDVFLIT